MVSAKDGLHSMTMQDALSEPISRNGHVPVSTPDKAVPTLHGLIVQQYPQRLHSRRKNGMKIVSEFVVIQFELSIRLGLNEV